MASQKEQPSNLWNSILEDVRRQERTNLSSSKKVLILGDQESGKATLVAKLQGNEDPKKGCGLEYSFITVRDEYRDEHTRLSVWVMDGDPAFVPLLRFALSKETFQDTLVIITVSMATPWTIMDSLRQWVSLLQDHVDALPFTAEEVKSFQQKQLWKWATYVEPGDDNDSSPTQATHRQLSSEDDLDLDLTVSDGVLTRNVGLDLVVVVTKTDEINTLEREYDYKEEHFEFIQQAVRKFCLQFGTTVFYTSVKEDKNCDLLYKYLVHRIYGLPFQTPALVVERDALFIPAGWDNLKKIAILYENLHSMDPDADYTDVIRLPGKRQSSREVEVKAQDPQTFLADQLKLLESTTPASDKVRGGSLQLLEAVPRIPVSPKHNTNMNNMAVGDFFKRLLERNSSAKRSDIAPNDLPSN